MQVDLCRHIKTNGLQCHAVALSGGVFCYFHNRLHRSQDPYRDKTYLYPHRVESGMYIHLSELEDAESIQIAISSVVNALATECITEKRAYALFQGLYLASANARRLRNVRHPAQVVRDLYKESWSSIPEGNCDIAPPGRTCEVDDFVEAPEESEFFESLTAKPEPPETTASPEPIAVPTPPEDNASRYAKPSGLAFSTKESAGASAPGACLPPPAPELTLCAAASTQHVPRSTDSLPLAPQPEPQTENLEPIPQYPRSIPRDAQRYTRPAIRGTHLTAGRQPRPRSRAARPIHPERSRSRPQSAA